MESFETVVHRGPEILGRTAVFVGTRVPVESLFDYLDAGDSLEEFLDDFRSVTREQALVALAGRVACQRARDPGHGGRAATRGTSEEQRSGVVAPEAAPRVTGGHA